MINDNANLMTETVDIVSSYVAKNILPAGELPGLITAVHGALARLGHAAPVASSEPEIEMPTPAQIKKSITPDALISFIDGKSYKTLRRHLTTHGYTPQSYRARFGLPADYPLVSANYSATRSELAKSLGLGQQRRHYAAA